MLFGCVTEMKHKKTSCVISSSCCRLPNFQTLRTVNVRWITETLHPPQQSGLLLAFMLLSWKLVKNIGNVNFAHFLALNLLTQSVLDLVKPRICLQRKLDTQKAGSSASLWSEETKSYRAIRELCVTRVSKWHTIIISVRFVCVVNISIKYKK